MNGLPVIRFGSSGGSDALGLPGLDLEETDYTVMAVVRAGSQSMNFPEFFLWGSSSGERSNLQLGYCDPFRVTQSHQGDTANVSTGLNATIGNC